MDFRKLLRSKTFWTGIGTIAFGVYQIVQGNTNEGIQSITLGAGLVFVRDAIE